MSLSRADLVLRLGLAFVLLYAAWSGFTQPLNWVGFLPGFLVKLFSPWFSATQLLGLFELVQVFLAVWLISGRQIFYAACLVTALLAGIVVFNLGALDILFRDIGLVAMAAALALLHWPKQQNPTSRS